MESGGVFSLGEKPILNTKAGELPGEGNPAWQPVGGAVGMNKKSQMAMMVLAQ